MSALALPPPPALRTATIALFLDVDGTLVEIEREPGAVHVPDRLCRILAVLQQAAARALVREVVGASEGALMLLEGKMVLELKPPGCDKGQAIAAYTAEAPFAGRQAVFAGDDVTDEAGFATVNRIGGVSIRIGADQRPTAATYGHEDVGAMQSWLVGLLASAAASARSA